MDSQGILTLLGFAQKGKKLAAGEANVEAYLKKGKIALLIIADDLSENRKKNWEILGEAHGVQTITFANKADLGYAVGMSPRGIIGICDEQMAKAILKKFL